MPNTTVSAGIARVKRVGTACWYTALRMVMALSFWCVVFSLAAVAVVVVLVVRVARKAMWL